MPTKVFPAPLQPGDHVGLVTPSTAIRRETLDAAVAAVDDMGLVPIIAPTARRASRLFTAAQDGKIEGILPQLTLAERDEYRSYIANGYSAGDPRLRARDINQFFADPEIKGIFCLRGGFSSSTVMPYLDYETIRRHPKLILGYSDETNIINGIYRQARLVCYHAPMPAPNLTRDDLLDAGQPDNFTYDYFDEFIMSDWREVELANPLNEPLRIIAGGKADGEIVGGNLSTLSDAVGTDYFPDVEGKILFVEEVKTHIPLCDLAWNHLKNAGVFDEIAGLIVGDFTKCLNFSGEYHFRDYEINELEKVWFRDISCPTVAGLKVGHEKETVTIPIGARCQLDADNKRIVIYHE